jgi:preprotein translocase subunit SecG
MLSFFITLFTVAMVLDCVVLVLLVLVQLPKKEAGAGLAFGGGATDALFGAGSGTVLTKITKYAAGTFFGLAIVLSMMVSNYHSRGVSEFQKNLANPTPIATPPAAPATKTPVSTPSTVTSPAPVTNIGLMNLPAEATNTAVLTPGTNEPSAATNAFPPK